MNNSNNVTGLTKKVLHSTTSEREAEKQVCAKIIIYYCLSRSQYVNTFHMLDVVTPSQIILHFLIDSATSDFILFFVNVLFVHAEDCNFEHALVIAVVYKEVISL